MRFRTWDYLLSNCTVEYLYAYASYADMETHGADRSTIASPSLRLLLSHAQ